MNKKSILLLAVCIAYSGIQYGCGEKKSADKSAADSKQIEASKSDAVPEHKVAAQKEIVCVWDGVPVRATPGKSGKYLSSINLGEVIADLGESVVDSADKREYVKVRFSDGKEGWAPTYGLIKNASVAAIKTDATICKRPDLLTITKIVLKPMEIIAVTTAKDEWVEIASEQKKKVGWIYKDAITTNKEDVTTAILINKKLAEKDEKTIAQKYEAIVAEAPFPNSVFITEIRKQLETMSAATEKSAESAPEESSASPESDDAASENNASESE